MFRIKNPDNNISWDYKSQRRCANSHIRRDGVSKKQKISQTGVQFKDSLYAGYNLAYQINEGNSQQIDNITDVSYRYAQGEQKVENSKVSQFSYDANGNLLGILTGTKQGDKLLTTNSRRMLWDEENRMLATNDNGYLTSYFYDAGGERTVKMSGDVEGVNINGQLSGIRTEITNFTAYINPYLIVRKGGEYTKHIYIGDQRITSKVGNSGMFNATINPLTLEKANKVNFTGKQSALTTTLKARYDSLGVAYIAGVQSGNLTSNAPKDSTSSYFYHSDHLGSSSLITDVDGDIVQHIEYVPYGGTFIDERRSSSSWHTPFLFSGKERDEETGLLYVSQRYQDEKYCIWYGVDQLALKYPNMSSYVYCAANPVKYVDPDGREVFMLFYTTGNNRGDEMFYAAALTRQRDIMNSSSFNPTKDIVVLSAVNDLSSLKGKVSIITQQYSKKYGKTAEFSMWSHAGLDGPTGTVPTSSNAVDGKQMSIEGWSNINFNWGGEAIANFLGCKTGVSDGDEPSFVTKLSAEPNFKDVRVSGQTSSAYPSIYTNYRENSDLGGGDFVSFKDGLIIFSPTYMVGGVGRSQDLNLDEQNVALPMRTSVNGKGTITDTNYQNGAPR